MSSDLAKLQKLTFYFDSNLPGGLAQENVLKKELDTELKLLDKLGVPYEFRERPRIYLPELNHNGYIVAGITDIKHIINNEVIPQVKGENKSD